MLGEQRRLVLGVRVGAERLVERDAAAVQVGSGRRLVDQRRPLRLVAPHVDVGGAAHQEVVLGDQLGVLERRDAVLDGTADAGQVEVGPQRRARSPGPSSPVQRASQSTSSWVKP